jgi:arabinofuranosyltransferase
MVLRANKKWMRHPLFIGILVFLAVSLAQFLGTAYKNQSLSPTVTTLERFLSDFSVRPEEEALREDVILKRRRFFSYGAYTDLPHGRYTAAFFFSSPESLQPAALELQLASERGRTILAALKTELTSYPAHAVISFQVQDAVEIEPRVKHLSGNQGLRIDKVVITRTGGIVPWPQILSRSLLYSLIITLFLLSLAHSFKDRDTWKFLLAGLFLFLGCFLILRQAWVSEDAFISLRHIENFLNGKGPVFNVNERVEGFTHPLWFMVVSLFRWLGLSPKGAVLIPGLLASFSALYLLFFGIRPLSRTGRYPWLNPGAAILIGGSAFIDFGTSGLETALSYLLLVLYAKFLLEDRWKRQPLATGLVAALLTLTRPDFGIFLVFLGGLYGFELLRRRTNFWHIVRYLVFPLLLVGGYQVFRMGYYAAFFPNPYYAKSGSASHWGQGLKYLADLFQGSLFWLILVLTVLAAFLNFRRKGHKNHSLVWLSGLMHGFFVVRGGGDFMHGRFLLPAFILLAASLTGAFDRFFEKKTVFKPAYAVICVVLFGLSLSVIPVQKKGAAYNYGISNERFAYYKDRIVPLKFLFTDTVILMWKNIGRNYGNLARKAKVNIRVAYKNVGFTGFYAGPRVFVVDQLGLTDPVVSRIVLSQRDRPGHEKHAPLGYLISRRLTFHDTPFPLWNEAAATRYGVLWDLSPDVLKKLDSILEPGFKKRIDIRITEYLKSFTKDQIRPQAEFLFFLRTIWYPYADAPARDLFAMIYREDQITRISRSSCWQSLNLDNTEKILTRVQGPLDLKKFFGNIVFALTEGRSLTFTED